MVLDSTQAADQAKAAVAQNGRLLQQKLAEKNKLLSQLEQAKMQEEMNKAMAQLNETVGDDVPTLNEVQQKIEARYAKAKAHERAEHGHRCRAASWRSSRRRNVEAQSRLSQLRAELGLDGGAPGAGRRGAGRRRRDQRRPGGRRLRPGHRGPARRPAGHLESMPAAASLDRMTRSSRWMTSWTTSPGRSLVRLPAT